MTWGVFKCIRRHRILDSSVLSWTPLWSNCKSVEQAFTADPIHHMKYYFFFYGVWVSFNWLRASKSLEVQWTTGIEIESQVQKFISKWFSSVSTDKTVTPKYTFFWRVVKSILLSPFGILILHMLEKWSGLKKAVKLFPVDTKVFWLVELSLFWQSNAWREQHEMRISFSMWE